MLYGYSTPRSPQGRSSLVSAPPWHYVGTLLVIEYWAEPEGVAAVLPPPLEPHPDGGRAAAMIRAWMMYSARPACAACWPPAPVAAPAGR